MERFSRTISAIGADNFEKIKNASVLVFGLGGVGGYVAEGLARSGVGRLTVVDYDAVSLSNINRQIIALTSTVGKLKTDLISDRIKEINPECAVTCYSIRYSPENAHLIDFSGFDYIVDAVDDVSAKTEICTRAASLGKRVISCMGTATHSNPSCFKISDLYSTSTCPLARKMRSLLKKYGVERGQVTALFSTEEPLKRASEDGALPSTVFCPSVAGLMIAYHVISSLIA